MLAEDLPAQSEVVLTAWDILFEDAGSRPRRSLAAPTGVAPADNAVDAVGDADVVISVVTAGQDLAAAESSAPGLKPGTWYLDLNSVAPQTRRDVAAIVDGGGGPAMSKAQSCRRSRPKRLASPILLGGPHAEAFLPVARELGFAGTDVYSAEVGHAAAAKMCRSVVVKGMEALITEALVAARHHGVEDQVLESLHNLFPAADWSQHARYMMSRSLEHGARRAEEMRESAATVREAGLEPLMSAACAERQDWAAQFADALEHEELNRCWTPFVHGCVHRRIHEAEPHMLIIDCHGHYTTAPDALTSEFRDAQLARLQRSEKCRRRQLAGRSVTTRSVRRIESNQLKAAEASAAPI